MDTTNDVAGAGSASTEGNRELACFIVDDDENIRRMLARVVQTHGVEAVGFDSVAAFSRGFNQRRPDIVFLDIFLNGSDAVEAIRHLTLNHYCGVLQLVSGGSNDLVQSVHRVCHQHGFGQLPPLHKPFRRSAVSDALGAARSLLQRLEAAGDPPAPAYAPRVSSSLLGDALDTGHVEFWYQPKIDLRSGKLAGAEALLRAKSPGDRIALPGELLYAGISPDLMDRVTEQAIITVLRDWTTLYSNGINLRLSVNSSLSSLIRVPVAQLVREGRPNNPDWPGLTIEITEDEALKEVSSFHEVATQLRIYDVNFSIDDFGLGYSSLARLRDLWFAEIKLDRSFVEGCSSDTRKSAICRAAIRLANDFGARSVAEGVNSECDLNHLCSLGCDMGQGFLFAEAAPLRNFIDAGVGRAFWMETNAPRNLVNGMNAAVLTPREKQVLVCVMQGTTNREAARVLNISPRTVEVHRARLMAKFGARNVVELLRAIPGGSFGSDFDVACGQSAEAKL